MEKYDHSRIHSERLDEEVRKRRADPVYAMRDDTARFMRETMDGPIAPKQPKDDEPPDIEPHEGQDPLGEGPGDIPTPTKPRPSGSPAQAYVLSA